MSKVTGTPGLARECRHYERLGDGRVRCLLCPHACRLDVGKVGICRVRANVDGRLCSRNFGRVCSLHLDPIEKKPLFHFYPGRPILSLGTIGCNLACRFCQNWQISQQEVPTRELLPQQAVELALTQPHNLGLAYTYNEPLIWFEYVLETAQLAHQAGLKNVLVTNGYINPGPLAELLPYIDAMNVDIKAMKPDFYRHLCKGQADPPRRTVELAHHARVVVEVTNLVIPGWNDAEADFSALVHWLAGVDPQIPLHFSRYHPDYEMTAPATPAATLLRARQLARRRLTHVYLGNMPGEGEDTLCPQCGATVVRRVGFSVLATAVRDGRCQACGQALPIVGL